MKRLCIFTMTFLILFPMLIFGQGTRKIVNLYSTRISTMTIERYSITDPTIPVYQKVKHNYTFRVDKNDMTLVSKEIYQNSNYINEADLTHIAVSNIRKITFVEKGSWLKGALIGSSVIFVAGFITGCILYDPEVTWAVPGPVIGLAVGAGSIPLGFAIGSAIGVKKHRFEINGNQSVYDNYRPTMKRYAIQYSD